MLVFLLNYNKKINISGILGYIINKLCDHILRIGRSNRALEVLRFIVESDEPRTLYKIGNSLKVKRKSNNNTSNSVSEKLIPWGSLDLAIKNLNRMNLIILNKEMSKKKGRNATIYVPTFKGLLVFLEAYEFPNEKRIDYSKDQKNILIRTQSLKKQKNDLNRVLKRNGKLLGYPLFQEIDSLGLHPRSYTIFIKIAKEVLVSVFISILSTNRQYLFRDFKEIKKKVDNVEGLFRSLKKNQYNIVTCDGKEIPYYSHEKYEQKMEDNKLFLNALNMNEEKFLRDSYFLAFLRFLPYIRRISNKALYTHTSILIKKKKEEFDLLNEQLEMGLATFGS